MPFFQVEIHLRKYITNNRFVLALDELQKQFISGDKYRFKGLLSRPGKILHILKDTLNKLLPVNAHQLVSGKLHVILTRVHDWRSVTVSEFATKEDLIQVRAAQVPQGREEAECDLSLPHGHPRGKPGSLL